MGKFICAGTSLQFETNNTTAEVIIKGTPSNKVLCKSLPVWFNEIAISVAGATQGSFTQTVPADGSIKASSSKVLSENKPVVLVGDKTMSPIMCTLSDAQGNTIQLPVTVTVVYGGQSEVSAI